MGSLAMLRRIPRVVAGAALGWVARCTFAVSIMASAAVGPEVLLDSIHAAEADSPTDVVAKSPPNAAIEAALRDDFLVFPIRTELQHLGWGRIFNEAKVFVLINGVKVFKGNDQALDMSALKLSKIREAIEPVSEGEPGNVIFEVLCRKYVVRLRGDGTRPANSIVLKDALEQFGRDVGFQDVEVSMPSVSSHSEYVGNWKRAVADFATGPGEMNVDEPGVGDQQVKLYPVRTRLSRFLYRDADCVIHILVPLDELDLAAALKTMKRFLPQVGLKKRRRVHFLYTWNIGSSDIADVIRNELSGEPVYRDLLGFTEIMETIEN